MLRRAEDDTAIQDLIAGIEQCIVELLQTVRFRSGLHANHHFVRVREETGVVIADPKAFGICNAPGVFFRQQLDSFGQVRLIGVFQKRGNLGLFTKGKQRLLRAFDPVFHVQSLFLGCMGHGFQEFLFFLLCRKLGDYPYGRKCCNPLNSAMRNPPFRAGF